MNTLLFNSALKKSRINVTPTQSLPKIELRVTDNRHSFPFLAGISLQKVDIFFRPCNSKWSFKIPSITVFISFVVRYIVRFGCFNSIFFLVICQRSNICYFAVLHNLVKIALAEYVTRSEERRVGKECRS